MTDQHSQAQGNHETTVGPALALTDAIHSDARDDLLRAVADPSLTGDLALALLKRRDLPGEVLEQLAKHRIAMKLRKVKIALACHPHTPRHVSVPLIRQFYTFDLMKVASSPIVPADVKITAEQALIAHLNTVTAGERLTLARQGSGRIAGALLLAAEQRVMRTALENSRMTEAGVVRAILRPSAGLALIKEVSGHAKWSSRREVQIALLRTRHLSLARALAFGGSLSTAQLREILQDSGLPENIKDQLLRESQAAQETW